MYGSTEVRDEVKMHETAFRSADEVSREINTFLFPLVKDLDDKKIQFSYFGWFVAKGLRFVMRDIKLKIDRGPFKEGELITIQVIIQRT